MAFVSNDPFYRPNTVPAYHPRKITYTRWQLLKRAWGVFRGKVDLESYDNLRGETHMLRETIFKRDGEIQRLKDLLAAMDDRQRSEYRKNKPFTGRGL